MLAIFWHSASLAFLNSKILRIFQNLADPTSQIFKNHGRRRDFF